MARSLVYKVRHLFGIGRQGVAIVGDIGFIRCFRCLRLVRHIGNLWPIAADDVIIAGKLATAG